MSSSIAEITANASKSKSGSDNLEKEAVGLEVAVRIHGSEVSLVALDAPEHAEPFEEDTSTMIVFPRGAVVKLRARVRSGHAVVLTNLQTKQTALCRIIQVNSAANAANYVKLEFSQPMPGFWGVRFPSDPTADASSAKSEVSMNQKLEQESIFSTAKAFELPEEMPAPAVDQAAKTSEPPKPLAPATPSPKPIETLSARDTDSTSYGSSEKLERDLMPLAAAPPKKAANATIQTPVRTPQPAPRAATPAPTTSEKPIFDSLSTDEDVFGSEKVSKPTAEAMKPAAEKRVFQASLHSLENAGALTAERRKKRSSLVVFGAIAAAILISAGGWYVMKNRTAAVQTVSASAPAANPISNSPVAQNPASAISAPVSTQPNASNTADAQAPASSADQSASQEPALDSTITVTPIHEGSPAVPDGESVNSDRASGAANIYSGNLTARPKASKHKNIRIAAPPPKISAGVPDGIVGNADNSGLSSLVGSVSAGLPAPPTVAPATSGGKIVPPRLIHSVPITYPAIANSNHVEGDVEVQTTIAPTGKVESAKAISGPVLLREAAVNSVRQWRYSPATLDGKPVSIQYTVTVRFHLNN